MSDWPHSPAHRLVEGGAYIVSASTYHKKPLFATAERLTLLRDTLFALAKEPTWQLQAWAVMPNHYHFVALPPDQPETLRLLVRRLHGATARALNGEEGIPGRRVWFQYWDTHLTFQKSYLARLKYVHVNPVRHGLARDAELYPWCSAAWFGREAKGSFYRTVMSFPIDRLKVVDVECEPAWSAAIYRRPFG